MVEIAFSDSSLFLGCPQAVTERRNKTNSWAKDFDMPTSARGIIVIEGVTMLEVMAQSNRGTVVVQVIVPANTQIMSKNYIQYVRN